MKLKKLISAVIRNGEWRQRWEGAGAPEDPPQTTDTDGSGTKGMATTSTNIC